MNALLKAIHGRPRGFVDWRPQAKTAELVQQVRAVLDEYRERLPLTLRQIFYRLAVLPGHIEQFDLLTAPPKPTDRRNFYGETVQAEALPPDVLAELVRAAIVGSLDADAGALEAEKQERAELLERLGGFDD